MASRVAIPLRVSQDIADSIDAVRGTRTRQEWVADAIALALHEAKPARRVRAGKEGDACPPHPKGRVIKGFCYRCGQLGT